MKGVSKMKRKLLFIPLILAAIGVLAAVVMLLWNWVMPGLITGALQIDYWRALGLLILCRILFGGLRGHKGGPRPRTLEAVEALAGDDARRTRTIPQQPRRLLPSLQGIINDKE
jgi:hypothetical protein